MTPVLPNRRSTDPPAARRVWINPHARELLAAVFDPASTRERWQKLVDLLDAKDGRR